MSINTENLNYNDFKNICRTCLFKCDLKPLQDYKIIDILNNLTGVSLQTNGELPQQICRKCYEKLYEIHAFSVQCKQTYSSLMKCLNNLKNTKLKQGNNKSEETSDGVKIKEEITIEEHDIEFVPIGNFYDETNCSNMKIKEETCDEMNEIMIPETSEFNTDQNINCLQDDLFQANTSDMKVENEESFNLNDVCEMRKRFEEKLAGLVSRKKDNSTFLSSHQYEERIRAVKEAKDVLSSKKGKRPPIHYWLLERFDVVHITGKEKLIKRIADKSKPVLYFVHQDELFDILHSTHLAVGHGGRNRMIQELQRKYCNITRETVMVYLSLCVCCQKKSALAKRRSATKPSLHSALDSRAQIELIDMQSRNYQDYRFILVYQDHLTKFVLLRPLKTKRAEEVAHHLLDIYTTFGAPVILQSADGDTEFVNAVIAGLHKMWPSVKIVPGKPRHNSVEIANGDVETMLAAWMAENNSPDWPLGLKFVQFQKNRALHSALGRSPFEAMFGSQPVCGLTSVSITTEAIDGIHSEEDLDKALTTDDHPILHRAEESESLKNCTTCSILLTEEGTNSKCLSCARLESIEHIRKRAGECLEKQPQKMMKQTQDKFPPT